MHNQKQDINFEFNQTVPLTVFKGNVEANSNPFLRKTQCSNVLENSASNISLRDAKETVSISLKRKIYLILRAISYASSLTIFLLAVLNISMTVNFEQQLFVSYVSIPTLTYLLYRYRKYEL